MTSHCVYYCYNEKGEILYIGCTKRILDRLSQHKSQSAWVHALHSVRLRWFESFNAARCFEEKAIARNMPKYNRLEPLNSGGKVVWIKPKKELPALSADCLERFKAIRESIKKRVAKRADQERSAS